MAFRTTARTLAPLLKSPIAFKHLPPLASSSRTILQSTKTTAPPSLPYARFAARFKSTNTSAPGSTSSVLSTTIAEGESATASSAELEDEASRSTKLNFTDKDGNPLRIEPKLYVPSSLLFSPRFLFTFKADPLFPPSCSHLPILTPIENNPEKSHRSLTFTCSVDKCGERSTHEFAKRSYERGIVIVQCPGCKNR
jgi:hypothetical protein